MLIDNLRRLREQAKYSAKDFAKLLGITYTTYLGYENNGIWPSQENLLKIANALHVTVDELLGNEQTELQRCIHLCEKYGFKLRAKESDTKLIHEQDDSIREVDDISFELSDKQTYCAIAKINNDYNDTDPNECNYIYYLSSKELVEIVHKILNDTIYVEMLSSLEEEFGNIQNKKAKIKMLNSQLQRLGIADDVDVETLLDIDIDVLITALQLYGHDNLFTKLFSLK